MSKIIDFDVISSASLEMLIGRVKELAKFGWQPQGGIAAAAEQGSGVMFYLAVVKCEPELSGGYMLPDGTPATLDQVKAHLVANVSDGGNGGKRKKEGK